MERAASRLSPSAGFSLYASWKCFSALTPARNFSREPGRGAGGSPPWLRSRSATDSLFELFDEPLPVANVFELLQTFLQVHGFPRLSQTEICRTAEMQRFRARGRFGAIHHIDNRSTRPHVRDTTGVGRRSWTHPEGLNPSRNDRECGARASGTRPRAGRRDTTGACRRASTRAAELACTGRRSAARRRPCKSSSGRTGAAPSPRSCAAA